MQRTSVFYKIGQQRHEPVFETPLYKENGDKYPRSMEYVNKCVQIVEWWTHRHKCDIDQLLEKLR